MYRRGPGRACHVAGYSTWSWVGSQSPAASSFTGNSISRQARSENRDVGLWAETCGTATVRQFTRRDILSPARMKAASFPLPGRGPRTPPLTDRNGGFHGKHALLLADASPHRLRGKHRAASRRPMGPAFHGKPRTLPTASTWIAAESRPASEKYDLTGPVARETGRNGPCESLVRRAGGPLRSIPSTLSVHGGVHRASFHVNHRLLAQRSPSSGLPVRSRRP